MKKELFYTLIFTIECLIPFPTQYICAETPSLEMQANKVVDALNEKDFTSVVNMFNKKMNTSHNYVMYRLCYYDLSPHLSNLFGTSTTACRMGETHQLINFDTEFDGFHPSYMTSP